LSVLEFKKVIWDECQYPWSLSVNKGETLSCEISQKFPAHFLSESFLLTPFSGNIDFASKSLVKQGALAYQQIGWIFSEVILVSNLSLEDNLLLPLIGTNKQVHKSLLKNLNEALSLFDIEKSMNMRPHQVSKRDCQIICMLRSVVHFPKIALSFLNFHELELRDGDAFLKWLKPLSEKLEISFIFFQKQGWNHPLFKSYQWGPEIKCKQKKD
jgi:ABC-type sugar transport system ATPase subunit